MKIQLSVSGLELSGELEKYANGKITQLARRVPRKLREAAACEVQFTQKHKKGVKFSTCSISFTVGETVLRAEETTLHMYAALDIAAVQVERQLADYVATQYRRRLRTRVKHHFRGDK